MLQAAILTVSSIWEEGMIWEKERILIFSPRSPYRYKSRHPSLGTFETNYKMATSDGERLISTISRKLGTVNSLNML